MRRASPVSGSGRAPSTRGSASSARGGTRRLRSTAARACWSRPRRRGCSTRSAAPSSRGARTTRFCATWPRPGPSELDDLQLELGLAPKELRRLRAPLERCGAIVSRSVVYEDPHRHTSELARWDQRFPEPAEDGGLAELVVVAVRAAVVAPERELARWFPWWEDDLVESLVAEGRLTRPEQGWVSAAETASARGPAAPAP